MAAMRAWEEHSHAQGSAYIVGKQLAIWAQPDTNLAWAENPRLARACRLSVRQVQRALRSLELAREIVRQPRSPGGPRRTYLIDPAGAGQLDLFVEGDTRVMFKASDVTLGAGADHDTTGLKGDTHARACIEGQKDINHTPPAPQGGSAHPRQPRGQDRQQPSRRRRRRGAQDTRVAVQACPLPGHSPALTATLDVRWSEISERLRHLVGEDTFAIWFADAHLHALSPLTVAVDPHKAGWTISRFGPVLGRVDAGVVVVACARIGAPA